MCRQKLQIAATHTHTHTAALRAVRDTHRVGQSCTCSHTLTHTHTGVELEMQTPPLTVSSLHSIEICSCHKMLQAKYKKKSCKRWQKLQICWEIENLLFLFIYFIYIFFCLFIIEIIWRFFYTAHCVYAAFAVATRTNTHTHARSMQNSFCLFNNSYAIYFILYFVSVVSFARIPFSRCFLLYFILFNYIFSFFRFTGNFHAVCALQYKCLARSSIYKSCAAFLLDDVVVVGGRRLQAATATSKKSNKMPKKKAQQQQQVKYNKPKPNTNTKRDETSETKRNETKLSARRRQRRRRRCLFL